MFCCVFTFLHFYCFYIVTFSYILIVVDFSSFVFLFSCPSLKDKERVKTEKTEAEEKMAAEKKAVVPGKGTDTQKCPG